MAPSSKNTELALAFYRALETDHMSDLENLLAPDWLELPPAYPGQPPGAAGYIPFVQGFKKALPDGRFQIEDVIESGDKVVVRTLVRGTHRGDFLGIPATGRPVEFGTIDIHQIAAGRIARSWHIEDFFGAIRQLKAAS